MERFFGVFCKTRKTTSGDWFAILSSFIQQLLIECLLWGRWCAGCWGYGGGQNGPSPWFYGACHMVQLHQREWRVGEVPCSLFYDTHPSGKIQHPCFCFIAYFGGGLYTVQAYIWILSLSQDRTSLTLFSLLQFLLKFYRQNFPLPWDSINQSLSLFLLHMVHAQASVV